jgi:hypothetical protein
MRRFAALYSELDARSGEVLKRRDRGREPQRTP